MLNKIGSLIFSTIYLSLLANICAAQTQDRQENTVRSFDDTKLCQMFSGSKQTGLSAFDAPLPVRRKFVDKNTDLLAFTTEEIEFYHSLGLSESQDGGYECVASDPENARRRFTLFKLKKVDGVIVVSAFLDGGNFITGQKEAITDFFLETIDFYTEIPNQYYPGIKNYFQEFYSRIVDGRIEPSIDRVYLVDEPESTVILYHPLQGSLPGTGLSLNIPLN